VLCFVLIVVLFCVMCVICLLCLILLPLPPGNNLFADGINNNNNNKFELGLYRINFISFLLFLNRNEIF
jgi:hypothetical protein